MSRRGHRAGGVEHRARSRQELEPDQLTDVQRRLWTLVERAQSGVLSPEDRAVWAAWEARPPQPRARTIAALRRHGLTGPPEGSSTGPE
jgi:hypothetical protein